MNDTIFERITNWIEPLLSQLLHKTSDEVAEVKQLRRTIASALANRIACLEHKGHGSNVPNFSFAELARLRCLLSLAPSLGRDSLRHVLGMVAIDGRPGDYIMPAPIRSEDLSA